MKEHDEFVAEQDAHFAEADTTHFHWQTKTLGFSEREAHFLSDLTASCGSPMLEIGCGEGANLYHLTGAEEATGVRVGLDRSAGKLGFAARAVPSARFACGDGNALPFRDGTFASVVIRDVLHHLPSPRDTLAEAARVLQPGGHFALAEPNVHNPLIRLQMVLVPAERGAARSDEAWIRKLLHGLPLDALRFSMAAPFPIDRVVLHPTFGRPQLGRNAVVRKTLDRIESVGGRLLGPRRWSYVVAQAVRS